MRGRVHIFVIGAALASVAPATQATAATTGVRSVIGSDGAGPSAAVGTTHGVMKLRRAAAASGAANRYQVLRNSW
jgi:hypothetical protein